MHFSGDSNSLGSEFHSFGPDTRHYVANNSEQPYLMTVVLYLILTVQYTTHDSVTLSMQQQQQTSTVMFRSVRFIDGDLRRGADTGGG